MLNPKSVELPNDSSSPSCRSSANLGTCRVAFPRKRLGISPSSHEIMQPCKYIKYIYIHVQYTHILHPNSPQNLYSTFWLWTLDACWCWCHVCEVSGVTHKHTTLAVASTVLFLGATGPRFIESICGDLLRDAWRSLSITKVLFSNHPKPFFSFACHGHEDMQGNATICYLRILKESYWFLVPPNLLQIPLHCMVFVIQCIHAGPNISQCLVENMFLLPCLCRAILCFWFFFFFGWGTWCSRYCGCWLWSFWSNRCWCRCRWRCCCWRWRCCCWRWRCCCWRWRGCRRWRCFCCRWWCGWRRCCWCRWCCRCWFGGCRLCNFLCFWHSWRHAGWHWGRRRGHRGWGLHGGWQRFGGRRGSWSFLNSESTWRNHQHGSSKLKTLKSRFKLATVVELDLSSHSICISDISCCNLLTMTSQWFHPKLFNQTILVQKIEQK